MNALEQKIRQIESEIADAFNRGEIDEIMDYFDDELIGFSSTKHVRLRGEEAMRRTFAYYLKHAEIMKFELDGVEVNSYGPVAVSTFYWSIFLKSENTEHEVAGRGSHVFVDRDGEWKIVHEHFSRAQHPPELWDTSPGE